MTCHKYTHLWPLIRERLGSAPHLFFIGGADATHLEGDVLHIACNDAYDGLCEKMLHLLHFLHTVPEFADVTHILKIDDFDTVCTEETVRAMQYSDLDYGGPMVQVQGARDYHFYQVRDPTSYWYNRPYTGPYTPWVNGGRGYILSRGAIEAICTAIPRDAIQAQTRVDIYEDLMIGKLLWAAGFRPIKRDLGIRAKVPQTELIL